MHITTKRLPEMTMGLGLSLLLAASASAQGITYSQIQRGRYLSQVGDCASCHTAKGGAPLAGGFPLATPFGTIYSSNITPDPETGIGKWTNDEFYRAMHDGIRRDGKYLYPAMPYPWFTKMSRSDIDAIRAYLDTVPPVRKENKPNELPWPLSWRTVMAGWNLLFFHPGEYIPDASRSKSWNRGAYLVEGGAHCAACHSAKNMFGATAKNSSLSGGDAGESWFAPSLTDGKRDGIGSWTATEIMEYLKTGSNAKTAAAGPMIDVVMNSTQHFTDADLKAVATYLKGPESDDANGDASQDSTATGETPDAALSKTVMAHGESLYLDQCMGCHMAKGQGQENAFPPLDGSTSVQAEKPDSLIQVVLAGERMAAPHAKPTGLAMPAFAWKLNNREVADLVTYIRNAWSNHASAVDEDDVAAVRSDLKEYGGRPQQPLAAQE